MRHTLFTACLYASSLSILSSQVLEITPNHVLTDEAAVIRASGLQPNEQVTIEASLVDGADETWSAHADFVADARGVVDLSRQAPVRGSYKPISAMGLIWSMLPRSKSAEIYRPPTNLAVQVVNFRLLHNGVSAATAELQQMVMGPGVTETRLKGMLHGSLFEPAGAAPHPGVLVLGGSEGGVPSRQAAWLASHGYVALALAYFRYENLPPRLEAIPLEYFGWALGWMKRRPEIAADRLGVLGTSRGGELALQLGSMYPDVRAVVAFVPASYRHGSCCGRGIRSYAWTWKNMPLAFVGRSNRGDAIAPLEAAIPLENTRGPILLLAGDEDGVWDSASMTAALLMRLKQSHFSYPYRRLAYPHAGHRAGHPAIIPAWQGTVRHPVSGEQMHFGGTAEGNALSSLDAIPKVLAFLEQSLHTPAASQ